MRKDFDSEKSLEVDKAKREIDSLLQKELEEMKVKFSQSMQERQRELEEDHKKVWLILSCKLVLRGKNLLVLYIYGLNFF